MLVEGSDKGTDLYRKQFKNLNWNTKPVIISLHLRDCFQSQVNT